jgi:hypothetical protein
MEKLEVTVIPVDEEPYSKTITYSTNIIGKFSFLLAFQKQFKAAPSYVVKTILQPFPY